MIWQGGSNAYDPFAAAHISDTGHTGRLVRAVRRVDHDRSSRAARIHAADGACGWLFVDARLLGVWRGRLLLGAGNLGDGSRGWLALDSRLLGLGRQRLCLERWLLGYECRLLRRR